MSGNPVRIGVLPGLVAGIAPAMIFRNRFDAVTLVRWIQDAWIWVPLLFMAVCGIAAVL